MRRCSDVRPCVATLLDPVAVESVVGEPRRGHGRGDPPARSTCVVEVAQRLGGEPRGHAVSASTQPRAEPLERVLPHERGEVLGGLQVPVVLEHDEALPLERRRRS